MTAHLGVLAALALILVAGVREVRRERRVRDALLVLLAVAALFAEASLWRRESRLAADWTTLAPTELSARLDGIVEYLRVEGTRALDEIRAVGADADTRALLSGEAPLERVARHPVFLDLRDRFPAAGTEGITVYDRRGAPRAWAGWSPTATMSLPREPSRETESVRIRKGNIFTLLEAVHPVPGPDGVPLGYIVFQSPLRVQFPLQNRFLRIEDVLRGLEGGGGVRADLALELSVTEADAVRHIRASEPKFSFRGETASCSASLLPPSGDPIGRVSLSGLSRPGLLGEGLSGARSLRVHLLFFVFLLTAIRVWFAVDALGRVPALPRGLLSGLLRIALTIGARVGLHRWQPWREIDLIGAFDPGLYASMRFGGVLRSPGELTLTALALLLVVREVRRLVATHEETLRTAGRKAPIVSVPVAVALALLVGSLVGLHWERILDVARNSNTQLYGGLDPFSSWSVAALELALLLLGSTLLLAGDVLLRAARALSSRVPGHLAGGIILAVVLFATAVKGGSVAGLDLHESVAGIVPGLAVALEPALDFLSDLVPAIPVLAALAVWHRLGRLRPRAGATMLLAIGVLAAVANFVPVREGIEARRRALVELAADERNESPSTDRQILLQSTLSHFVRSEILQAVLDEAPRPEHANLAFVLWAHSPLVGDPAGCLLRLVDAQGEPLSTFSLGYPPELRARRLDPSALPSGGASRFRREEVGSERLDLYTRVVPLARGGEVRGAVELSLAYSDDLQRPTGSSRRVGSVFSNLTGTPEFLRFSRDVPDRVDRYRGDELIASTDPEGALGKRVRPAIIESLADPNVEGKWETGKFRGKIYHQYHVRERDGNETVGYLSFGIERHGWLLGASLLARSTLVTLVLAAGIVAFLMIFGGLVPGSPSVPMRLPRLGFRERVIGGFLIVSLLPTVLLGVAGRRLFVAEQRREFERRLLSDLEVSKAFLGRSLTDAARNAAASEEVEELVSRAGPYRSVTTPASADGLVVMSAEGQVLGASRAADLDLALLGAELPESDTPLEFFRLRGDEIFACAMVPIPPVTEDGATRFGGRVLAFQRIDAVRAAELERRVGSPVSFFAGGRLVATSKPELYQAEILSDLIRPDAYRRIELEGWRRLLLETRVGSTSFLASYAPLFDETDEPIGVLATLSPFAGEGLDLDASLVVSRIYFFCLLVFAGAIMAAVVLANRLTGPVSDLTAGAALIGSGKFGHRIRAKAPAEIGALVRSFNEMSQKLAESEVRDRERREYIEAIIRHVGSGVVSFDAKGRIATVNEAAARILRVEAGELIGRLPRTVAGGPTFDAVIAAVEPVLRGRRQEVVHEFETGGESSEVGPSPSPAAPPRGPVPTDEGLRTIRLVGTQLVDREGLLQGAVAVFEDLTDLIKSKKIKAWAEMARQVAHEIKNPLTPMKLSAQQLRAAWRDKHPKFDRILEESTETIVDRCEALRRIAVEFSDYARMPGRTIRREDLAGLLREAGRLYAETEARDVSFSMAVPEDSMWIRIDRDEVMRLFINLLENSIQAMPEGGALEVEARRLNGAARVTIADTGVGIPAENLARIWEPSFSTKTGGAGLGLPICRAIMEDYGGSIRIRSETGAGTTVTLEFPTDESGG